MISPGVIVRAHKSILAREEKHLIAPKGDVLSAQDKRVVALKNALLKKQQDGWPEAHCK